MGFKIIDEKNPPDVESSPNRLLLWHLLKKYPDMEKDEVEVKFAWVLNKLLKESNQIQNDSN